MRRRLSRRFPSRSVTAASPPAVTFAGADGLSDTAYYAGNAIPGQQAGFHVQCWVWIESQAVASANRVVVANVTAATNGWRFLTATTNATLNFGCFDTTGSVNRASASLTLTAGHIGRPLHLCGCIRSGGVVLLVDGVAVGAPTTITTYSVPGTPSMSIGRRMLDTLSCLGDIRVMGVSGGNYAPTDAEVLTARNAGLVAADVVAIPGATALWSFKQDGGANSVLLDRIGAIDLSRVGSPTYVTGM